MQEYQKAHLVKPEIGKNFWRADRETQNTDERRFG
jgi:hypothetical protein